VAALADLPGVHLAVVTVPYPHPMAAELTALAQRVGVADRVHLVPPVASAHVPDYLSSADVGVSPIMGTSVSYDLALPNKLFEFLHAGLPMVVSDCQGTAEFVAEHGLGRSFRAGDAHDLAAAAWAVLADPPRPDTTALRQEYSWQRQEQSLVGVYAALGARVRLSPQPWAVDSSALRWQ
jgi:glycosyltransferase involved in cell wall biosynthesis